MGKEEIKIIDYKDIGKVSFIRKNSARNLRITIRPFNEVRVTVPFCVSLERASRFVEEKATWIKKSQHKISRYEKRLTAFDFNTAFTTRFHKLELIRHPIPTIKTIIGHGKIQVIFPEFATMNDLRIQNAIRMAITKALRIEAKKFLPERTLQLSQHFKLSYSKVVVRDNKSRWGSCSIDNHISLNIQLMRLPQHLCDYVILHELAHTVFKHHQKTYWDFLNKVTNGMAKKLDKELNNYSPHIW